MTLQPRVKILDKAADLISGDREKDYGHPFVNFTNIAEAWTTYLHARHLLDPDQSLRPDDVAMMMALLKTLRFAHGRSEDSAVDGAGYFALAQELSMIDQGQWPKPSGYADKAAPVDSDGAFDRHDHDESFVQPEAKPLPLGHPDHPDTFKPVGAPHARRCHSELILTGNSKVRCARALHHTEGTHKCGEILWYGSGYDGNTATRVDPRPHRPVLKENRDDRPKAG